MLVILLTYTTHKTLSKGRSEWRKERDAKRRQEMMESSGLDVEATGHGGGVGGGGMGGGVGGGGAGGGEGDDDGGGGRGGEGDGCETSPAGVQLLLTKDGGGERKHGGADSTSTSTTSAEATTTEESKSSELASIAAKVGRCRLTLSNPR